MSPLFQMWGRVTYLVPLCFTWITLAGQNFDIIKAIKDKMDENGRKYPVSLVYGKSDKYGKLG